VRNRKRSLLMLHPADVSTHHLLAVLGTTFGITAPCIEFLPLGADADSAAYRAGEWFVKLRRGPHGAVGARVAYELFAQGIDAVVAPIPARDGALWSMVDGWRMLVYPFLDLTPASIRPLSDAQWAEFGAAVRRVHDAKLPDALVALVPSVDYEAPWRSDLRAIVSTSSTSNDALCTALAVHIEQHRARIDRLIERSETLAAHMRAAPHDSVVCHTDLHGYNVLTDAAGRVRIVDWDAPLRAPRERDLMFAGGAQFGTHSAVDELRLFYAGYGSIDVDAAALEYFRSERIIEDLVLYARQIRDAADSAAERAAALKYFRVNFEPGGTLDAAAA